MKKKKLKINSSLIFKSLMVFILVYLVMRAVPLPFNKKFNTMRPKISTYMNSFETQAVIIKNEKVYYATNKGNLETFIEEGERTPAGSRVAVLTALDSGNAIEEELAQINKSISEIENIKIDLDSLDDESRINAIKSIKNKIQEEIKNNNLDKIYILREQLNALVTGEGMGETSSDTTLNQLKKRQDELFKTIHENVKDYYIDDAAMISYKIDGYEEAYLPEDFEKYTYDKVNKDLEANKKDTPKLGQIVEKDQPIFKTIDNFNWYLGIKIDDLKTIKDLENKRTLKIRVNNKNEELEGKIIKINKFKNKGVVILEFKSKLQDYYDRRFLDLEVIESNTLGFKIPKTCLIEKDNIKGVMVKDISNIVRFRQVVILAEDGDNVYLKVGDDNGYLRTDKDETIRTISLFDEIFLKPKSVKDGKILN